jgi:hypothetical protein
MFDVIERSEYFDCLTKDLVSKTNISLKGIQDGRPLTISINKNCGR